MRIKRRRPQTDSASDIEDEGLPTHTKRAISAMEGRLTCLVEEISAMRNELESLQRLQKVLEAQGDLLMEAQAHSKENEALESRCAGEHAAACNHVAADGDAAAIPTGSSINSPAEAPNPATPVDAEVSPASVSDQLTGVLLAAGNSAPILACHGGEGNGDGGSYVAQDATALSPDVHTRGQACTELPMQGGQGELEMHGLQQLPYNQQVPQELQEQQQMQQMQKMQQPGNRLSVSLPHTQQQQQQHPSTMQQLYLQHSVPQQQLQQQLGLVPSHHHQRSQHSPPALLSPYHRCHQHHLLQQQQQQPSLAYPQQQWGIPGRPPHIWVGGYRGSETRQPSPAVTESSTSPWLQRVRSLDRNGEEEQGRGTEAAPAAAATSPPQAAHAMPYSTRVLSYQASPYTAAGLPYLPYGSQLQVPYTVPRAPDGALQPQPPWLVPPPGQAVLWRSTSAPVHVPVTTCTTRDVRYTSSYCAQPPPPAPLAVSALAPVEALAVPSLPLTPACRENGSGGGWLAT